MIKLDFIKLLLHKYSFILPAHNKYNIIRATKNYS